MNAYHVSVRTGRVVTSFVMLLFLCISVSNGVSEEIVPAEVYNAGEEGLKSWLRLCSNNEDILLEVFKDSNANVLESRLGVPYAQYLISSNDISKCYSSEDIIEFSELDAYSFPIIFHDEIVAFLSVKYLFISEEGVTRWYLRGVGLGLDKQRDYYRLKQEYPESKGHKLFAVAVDYPSKLFFLVKTADKEDIIIPVSGYSAKMVNFTQNIDEPLQYIKLEQVLPTLRQVGERQAVINKRIRGGE